MAIIRGCLATLMKHGIDSELPPAVVAQLQARHAVSTRKRMQCEFRGAQQMVAAQRSPTQGAVVRADSSDHHARERRRLLALQSEILSEAKERREREDQQKRTAVLEASIRGERNPRKIREDHIAERRRLSALIRDAEDEQCSRQLFVPRG